ncbi:MAG: MFS transporter [Oscillospiraceae bacterium]|nr:MFS transporter [Oscillospiraceae bacterium]
MSEAKKVKMTTFTWFAVFICGLGSTATGAQSIIKNFYVIYKEANMLTDGQMGTILSIMSIAQVLSYFYGGIISDIVKPRIMLTFACASYCISSVVLATNPGYFASIIIFCLFALTPFWAPMVKLLATTTPPELSGKVYGWLDSFTGLSGLVVGLVTTWAVASFGSVVSVRTMCIMYAVMAGITLIGVQIIAKQSKPEAAEEKTESEDDKFTFKNMLKLVKDPTQWLVWLGITFGYTGYIGLTYMSPMLVEYFGMSQAGVTLLDTVRNNVLAFVVPIFSGWYADKVGAVKSYFLWLAFYAASIVIILFIPWTPAYYIFAIAAVILLTMSLKGRSPLSNTLLTTVRTPMMLFSTSVAFESMVMTIPDTFAYSMAGNRIEKYGMTGYKYIFIVSIALVLGGLVCNILLDRRMKAGKDSSWYFAQNQKENA